MLDLRIGMWLGFRQIQRANPWTTILIIAVIMFTFLNLIAVSGILAGIVDGAMKETRAKAVGDIILSPLPGEDSILHTEEVLRSIPLIEGVRAVSPHYTGLATIEANYIERRDLSSEPDIIAIDITGIDPQAEENVTHLDTLIKEGSYFNSNENGYILIGKYLIDRYSEKFGDAFQSLDNIYPGDKVRISTGSKTQEFEVKGIVDSKIDMVSLRVYMPEKEFRRFFDRVDYDADEIIVRLNTVQEESTVKERLIGSHIAQYAEIETFTEGLPKFITDVKDTFALLGIFVGAIGITVASISVFIVVFINALSRKRQIGILKAIGISERAIEYAYVTQAGIYACVGALLGTLFTVYLLIPYFIENPIDFPYADTSLSLTGYGIGFRSLLLICVTLIAGFLPAWLIVKQNTLDSILGRK
jgi:putative ABC transport system permease protein